MVSAMPLRRMTAKDRVILRANEEIRDHGDREKAIAAVRHQIESPDSIPAERKFMRKVLIDLEDLS